MINRILILLCLAGCIPSSTMGQDVLSAMDTARIRNAALSTVAEIQKKLNFIKGLEVTTEEINDLKKNITSGARKIFYNDSALVENDINPELLDTVVRREQKMVKDYIDYFYHNYSKSDDPTVFVENIQVSHVKKSGYPYVKCYYTQRLAGRFKHNEIPYKEMKRVVEMRVSKNNSKWEALITDISFADENFNVEDTENDITVIPESVVEYRLMKENGEDFRQDKEEAQKIKQISIYKTEYMDAISKRDWKLANTRVEQVLAYDPYDLQARQTKKMVMDEWDKERTIAQQSEQKVIQARKYYDTRQFQLAQDTYDDLFRINQPMQADADINEKMKTISFIIPAVSSYKTQFNTGNYDFIINDCTKRIKEAKEKNNGLDMPEFYVWRAKSLLAKNAKKYNDDAKEDFDKALTLAPKYNEGLIERAQYYSTTAREINRGSAEQDLSTLILNNPGNAEYYRMRAILRDSINDLNLALQDYRRAVSFAPGNWKLLYEKADVEFRLKSYDSAIVSLTRAISIEPDKDAYFKRGLVYETTGKTELAGADFRQARVSGLSFEKTKQVIDISFNYYFKAQENYIKASYNNAIRYLDEAIRIYDKEHTYYYYRGISHFNTSNLKKALEDFNSAIELKNDLPDYYMYRGRCKYDSKNYQGSVQDFITASRLNLETKVKEEKNHPVLLYLANAFFQIGEYPSAAREFKNAFEIENDSAEMHNISGLAYYRSKDYVNAINSYSTAVKKDDKLKDAYYNRGLAYTDIKEWDEAADDFETINKLDPANAGAWELKANALRELGRHEEAAKAYNKFAGMTDKPGATYYQEALCWDKLARYPESLTALNNAKKHDGTFNDNKAFNFLHAYASLQTGSRENARSGFNAVLKTEPENAFAVFYLACIDVAEGKSTDALKGFEAAFKTKAIKEDMIKKETSLKDFRKTPEFKKLEKEYF